MSYAEIDIPMVVVMLSCSVSFNSTTLWTVALQAPLSTELSRQEYWRGLPFPPPGGSSSPGDQTHISSLAGGFFTTVPPGKPQINPWTSLYLGTGSKVPK